MIMNGNYYYYCEARAQSTQTDRKTDRQTDRQRMPAIKPNLDYKYIK